jgi:hypothetical protein
VLFLVVAVVDFLGGMADDVWLDVGMDRYLMLLTRVFLSKSIEGRMLWKRSKSLGLEGPIALRGLLLFVVASQYDSARQINNHPKILHSYLGRIKYYALNL